MWPQIHFLSFLLVLWLGTFGPWVNCPYTPTTLPIHIQLFLDFWVIFSPRWPLNFLVHNSPNLAGSRYPPSICVRPWRIWRATCVARSECLNVLAKNRRNWQVNLSIQASKSQKRDVRDFSRAKVCYSNRNVEFENFMRTEWREEKLLKGIVGNKMRKQDA